jgi:hypothetical protein
VKEKLRDLVPWVEKLLVTLAEANSDNDLEEAERRSQLEKSVLSLASLPPPHFTKLMFRNRLLDDIGVRALALLEKGKVARILDKVKDSGEVVGLVEELRRAIAIYQVSSSRRQDRRSLILGQMSQQRSIYNQVVKLTVSPSLPFSTPRPNP